MPVPPHLPSAEKREAFSFGLATAIVGVALGAWVVKEIFYRTWPDLIWAAAVIASVAALLVSTVAFAMSRSRRGIVMALVVASATACGVAALLLR
jgi:hypothetical protein